MMGGSTVIFTYKRKRFSSKPHKVEDLPPDPACKPQVEDLLIKEKPQIETQKADESKAEIHRTDHAGTDICETDAPLFNPEKIIKQSQIELLNINEPEGELQSELQIENELHSEIQIKNKCSLESDNGDNPQNELHKIDEPEVELPEKHNHQIGDQKADKLQCKEQERKDQNQLEPEKLGAELEADLSAEYVQESLHKSSEPQIETKELDEMQFNYPVEERAEESRNEKQKCESDSQKSNELQSGSSVEHPVADPSDHQLDSKLISQSSRTQLVEDYMEIDDGEDVACTHASSKTLTDPDRGKHESTAELPNLDQTKNNVAPNEKNLSCDKSKHTATSKQVRPIIDLTKPPVETELDIEMEALPPASISRSWRDKEVQLLESLDKHRKTKDQLIKGEKLNFDLGLSPDLLSLPPSLDQDVFYTLQSRARPKPSSAGTSRFGLPFPTSTTDSKGKNVNSIATHDFFANPGARDSFEHMHKQVLENIYTGSRILQDKLKYGSRTNNTYRTTSGYGASSYKLHDWSEEELDCLWIGVRRYGVNNWDAVLRDPRFIFTKFKTVEDLAARWEVEQRRLFSCPIPVPETLPLSHTNNWYGNSEAAYPLGEPYLEGSGCRAYNSSAGRYWHQPVGSGMVPMPDLIPRRGRPKYQIRRAPKAQPVTRTPSPPTSNHLTGTINTRNSGLPHWLQEVTDSPLGLRGGAGCASKEPLNSATLKRKGLCDGVVSEPLFEPNFKSGRKESERANKLVILDSDGASSEETLSA